MVRTTHETDIFSKSVTLESVRPVKTGLCVQPLAYDHQQYAIPHRDPDLRFHGILVGSLKGPDAQVSRDALEGDKRGRVFPTCGNDYRLAETAGGGRKKSQDRRKCSG